jgi:hypothetical protein
MQHARVSNRSMSLLLTHPLSEMNSKNFNVVKARQASKAADLTTICNLITTTRGVLNMSQTWRPSMPLLRMSFC